MAGVLPSAQFCNTLTYSVLQLWRKPGAQPYALHATWMRQQRIQYKLMRMREETLWRDAPSWYGAPLAAPAQCASSAASADAEGCAAQADSGLGPIEPPAGFLVYEPRIERSWLRRPPLERGGIPTHHLLLVHEQLRQLRNAFFLARALGRALILPTVVCTCEMGFFIYHITEQCTAPDHPTLHLPYNCSLDHYLEPVELEGSPYRHRERSFLANPRTPRDLLDHSTTRVRVCAGVDGACAAAEGEVSLPPKLRVRELRRRLGALPAKLLHFDDVLGAFGGFDDGDADADTYHTDLQRLLSSWCCTADERFKRVAGTIPYILPPLEGQDEWRGEPRLWWAAKALADIFDKGGAREAAAAIRPPQ